MFPLHCTGKHINSVIFVLLIFHRHCFFFFLWLQMSSATAESCRHLSASNGVSLWFSFHPCFAGLSCRPSARARGTWSTVHFATERCPCLSSSPWWTAPCSSALRGTTRSSMTFRVTCKVRLALAFHQNLLTVIRSSRCDSNSCFECVSVPQKSHAMQIDVCWR